MSAVAQKTWLSEESDPITTLDAWFGFRDLLGAKITGKEIISNVMVNVKATIYYRVGSSISKTTVTARIVRELAPYVPDPNGEWGINPASLLREE